MSGRVAGLLSKRTFFSSRFLASSPTPLLKALASRRGDRESAGTLFGEAVSKHQAVQERGHRRGSILPAVEMLILSSVSSSTDTSSMYQLSFVPLMFRVESHPQRRSRHGHRQVEGPPGVVRLGLGERLDRRPRRAVEADQHRAGLACFRTNCPSPRTSPGRSTGPRR